MLDTKIHQPLKMENEEIWEKDSKKILETYFECINLQNLELYGILKENYSELGEVRPLIDFIISRLEAVSTMVLDWRLWDAEIVLRSALETLVKFVYILAGTKDDHAQRCHEFWYVLPELYSLKLSMQAKRNLEHLSKSEIHRLAYTPLILPIEKEDELKNKGPKPESQKIEQHWSFSEIVLFLSRQYKGSDMEVIIALAHGYRMASHVHTWR